ncbi:MAG: NUDIX hydrolase [Chloroflexi bacterium]|nr:NUDIX hydrolase [Chloroflexota bacterium]
MLRVWRELPGPLKLLYLRFRYGWCAVGVAALIRDEAGRILVVHRTYSRDEPWALPGGWLERKDPTIAGALERELREETGLRVRVGPVAAIERTGFAVVVLMRTELLDSLNGFRPSAEISEVTWAEPNRVGELSRFNARLLRQALT